jgi:dihydroorotate dehydrogenase electron transfer subunit
MMEQICDIEGVILQNRPAAPGYHQATVELSQPMPSARPGQFIMMRLPGSDVFLRRPFSIYDQDNHKVSILYRVVGKGTEVLSLAHPGEKVMVLGPLGNGFTPLDGHTPVIVAGGIGFAGIQMLWSQLKEKAFLFWGCPDGKEAGLMTDFESARSYVATLDGSSGHSGTVIDLLSRHLNDIPKPFQIFSCGPQGMFLALKELLSAEDIPCQVLLEERMACGIGICFCCVTKTLDETEPYKRVCKEGPVFDLWQISL